MNKKIKQMDWLEASWAASPTEEMPDAERKRGFVGNYLLSRLLATDSLTWVKYRLKLFWILSPNSTCERGGNLAAPKKF